MQHIGSTSLTTDQTWGPPALGMWRLSYWTTREVLFFFLLRALFKYNSPISSSRFSGFYYIHRNTPFSLFSVCDFFFFPPVSPFLFSFSLSALFQRNVLIPLMIFFNVFLELFFFSGYYSKAYHIICILSELTSFPF